MKKLLYIALFSIAITVNATEKKEIVTINSKEIKTENSDFEKEISEDDVFFGCASEGNGYYSHLRMEGMSHRDARTARRAYVRHCRNYFWQFGIF